MKLECTRKLLDYLGVKPEQVKEGAEPIFSWTANLVTINRRKTAVVVNVASRCAFVLYGLKAKNIPQMPELIIEGIRKLLRSEYVRPEIIEKYLDECGRTVSFAANSSRSVIANCNKACQRVDIFCNLFEQDDMYQQKLLPWTNNDVILWGDYTLAHQILIARLKEKYGDEVQACHAAELEVDLQLSTPCKRILTVPSNINFYQLHRVLQNAFAWRDYHLHQFILETDDVGRPTKIVEPIDIYGDDIDLPFKITRLDSLKTTVRDVFEEYEEICYEYDFGDDWIHIIKFRRFIEECPTVYPECSFAIGDAPMEDCGGPDGFDEVRRIMSDPADPEYADVCDWLGRTWWERLDMKRINYELRAAHRRSVPAYLG